MELAQGHVRIGYQNQVDASENSVASTAASHFNGPTARSPRWVLLRCATRVRGRLGKRWGHCVGHRPKARADGFDVGSALVAARYDERIVGQDPSLAALADSVKRIGDAVASLGTQVPAVSQKADEAIAAANRLFSFTARLSSGAAAVNALGNLLAMVEDIKTEV